MTAHWLVAAACLVAAAVVVGWPLPGRQARLLGASRPAAYSLKARIESLSSRRAMILAVALAALAGTLLAGPVAGVVAGAYGGIAVRTVLRRRASRAETAMRTRSLDALCGLAADLRAGISASAARSGGAAAVVGAEPVDGLADPVAGIEDRRMAQLAEAAWHLAERTGAPIADLIERIEADARAMDRTSAAAAAQAAGARATAWLLAGLPVGGIGLGYSIGADPLDVLLHTPVGAACAVGAILLQVAGLAWADRLASAGTTQPSTTAQPSSAGQPSSAARPEPAPALHPAPAPTQMSTPAPAPALTQPSSPAPWPPLSPPARTPAPVAAPRWTVDAEAIRLRSAAPARTKGGGADRAAGRPRPRPRPRAAFRQSGAPGPGSEA